MQLENNIRLMKPAIITITYNNSEGLRRTIESVQSQTYRDFEHIIVDGGSTDGSVEIIEAYASDMARMASGSVLIGSNGDFVAVDSQDSTLANGAQPHEVTQPTVSTQPSIKWISEKDNGMYHAIMKGMAMATGEIVTWINSDDMYHTGALHIVGQIFAQLPEVEWLTGTPTLYNAEGRCVKTFPIQYWSWERFKRGDFRWLQQESTFFRKSLFDKVGGLNLDYRLAADFELWCKMFQHAKLYSVDTILGGFRQHGEQLSIEGKSRYEDEVREICKLHYIDDKIFCKRLHKMRCRLIKRNKIYYDFVSNQWQQF